MGMETISRIGKYEIRGVLGRGGLGVVYRAHHPDLDRPVAIKVMVAGEHGSDDLLKRFLREARSAASIAHPGIVQVHDVGSEGGQHYIVMELVDGKPLSAVLKERRLAPEEALRICLDVALALEEAHGKGVIHRDIKPSNLLLDRSGRPKIADFGLATSLDDERLTLTGDLLGTAWYMSPEQAFGDPSEIDARTDVYSLGAVLYEALTGRPPFDGARATVVLRKLELHDASPPSRANPALDPALDPLVLRALEKDRGKRYASAGDFAQAIRRALGGEKEPAPVPSPPRRRALAAAGLALAALLAGWLVGRGASRSETTPADRARAAILAASDGALAEAQAALERRLAEVPGDGESWHWLSQVLRARGAVRGALEAASAAIGRGHDTPASRADRAHLWFLRNELLAGSTPFPFLRPAASPGLEEDANQVRARGGSADQALVADLALLSSRRRYREVIDRIGDRRDAPFRTYRWIALLRETEHLDDQALRASSLKAALDEVRAALEREPRDRPARFLASLFAARLERREEALALSRRLAEAPGAAEALLFRAAVLLDLEEPDRAIECAELAASLDPGDAWALALRHALRFQEADPGPGVVRLAEETLAALAPQEAQSFPAPGALAGAARLVLGKWAEAEETFARLRARFGDPDSWGEAMDEGRVEQLDDLVRFAGEKSPRFLCLAGVLLAGLGAPAAEDALKSAVERLDAQDAGRRYLLEKGVLDELRRAARRELGAIRAGRGDLDGAVEELRRALDAGEDPEDLRDDLRLAPLWESPRHRRLLERK